MALTRRTSRFFGASQAGNDDSTLREASGRARVVQERRQAGIGCGATLDDLTNKDHVRRATVMAGNEATVEPPYAAAEDGRAGYRRPNVLAARSELVGDVPLHPSKHAKRLILGRREDAYGESARVLDGRQRS